MKKLLTKETYLDKVKILDDKYWNNTLEIRWNYMLPVLEELKLLNPQTSIELGTAGISLMNFSDSMDKYEKYIDNNNHKYLIDAKITPWNIPDKKYDVFVALQVLEHLSPNQIEIFNEIKRISKSAIITLPYMWNCEKNDCHYMIDYDIINKWTQNTKPYKTEIINNRIMLCYNFNK